MHYQVYLKRGNKYENVYSPWQAKKDYSFNLNFVCFSVFLPPTFILKIFYEFNLTVKCFQQQREMLCLLMHCCDNPSYWQQWETTAARDLKKE